MSSIRLEAIEKWFGSQQIIKGIDLTINDGEFVIFVGPSGCGKSTLLRLIAGLEEASRGSIYIDDADVTALPPSERKLSMVFQSYALYPHMTVRQNVGFGLKTAGVAKAEIQAQVQKTAEVLKLDEYLDRRPKALSGGQRQRVAIGRAIVRDPKGFLFDEPLSNLDAALRVEMRLEIAKLHQQLKSTMIYVTHDQVEAMTLADKIVVLQNGTIEQVGTPRELYEQPDNLFVAQFIGSPKMNILPCSANGEEFQLPGHGRGKFVPSAKNHVPTKLGIRPEHITVASNGTYHCQGLVEVVEYLGADTYLYVSAENLGMITVRTQDNDQIRAGDTIGLRFNESNLHFFDADNQRL